MFRSGQTENATPYIALTADLASQGVTDVTVTLSDDAPRQHPKSGKFKHVINMEKESG